MPDIPVTRAEAPCPAPAERWRRGGAALDEAESEFKRALTRWGNESEKRLKSRAKADHGGKYTVVPEPRGNFSVVEPHTHSNIPVEPTTRYNIPVEPTTGQQSHKSQNDSQLCVPSPTKSHWSPGEELFVHGRDLKCSEIAVMSRRPDAAPDMYSTTTRNFVVAVQEVSTDAPPVRRRRSLTDVDTSTDTASEMANIKMQTEAWRTAAESMSSAGFHNMEHVEALCEEHLTQMAEMREALAEIQANGRCTDVDASAAEIQEWESRNVAMKMELQSVLMEATASQEALRTLVAERDVEEHHRQLMLARSRESAEELRSALEQIAELEDTLRSQNVDARRLPTLEAEYEACNAELRSMTANQTVMKATLQSMAAQVPATATQIDHLETELALARNAAKHGHEKEAERAKKIAELEAELELCHQRETMGVAELSEKRQKAHAASAQVVILEARLAEQQRAAEEAAKSFAESERRLEEQEKKGRADSAALSEAWNEARIVQKRFAHLELSAATQEHETRVAAEEAIRISTSRADTSAAELQVVHSSVQSLGSELSEKSMELHVLRTTEQTLSLQLNQHMTETAQQRAAAMEHDQRLQALISSVRESEDNLFGELQSSRASEHALGSELSKKTMELEHLKDLEKRLHSELTQHKTESTRQSIAATEHEQHLHVRISAVQESEARLESELWTARVSEQSLSKELSDKVKELQRLRGSEVALSLQLDEHEAQSARQNLVVMEHDEHLQAQIHVVKDSERRMAMELDDARASERGLNVELSKQNAELEHLQVIEKRLSLELSHHKTENMQQSFVLREQISSVQDSRTRLATELQDARTSEQRLSSELYDKNSEFEQLQGIERRLSFELNQHRTEHVQQNFAASEREQHLHTEISSIQHSESRVRSELQATCASEESLTLELTRKTAELLQLKVMEETLTLELHEHKSESMQQKVTSMKHDQHLQSQISSLRVSEHSISTELAERTLELERFNSEIGHLQGIERQLMFELSQHKEENAQQSYASLKRDQQLQAQISSVRESEDRIAQELQASRASEQTFSSELSKKTSQLEQCSAELSNKKLELEHLQGVAKEVQYLQQQLAMLAQSERLKEDERADALRSEESLACKLHDLQNESADQREHYSRQMEALERQLEAGKSAENRYVAELRAAGDMQEQLNMSLQRVKAEIKVVRENEAKQAHLLKVSLAEAESEMAAHELHMQGIQQAVNETQKRVLTATTSSNKLKKELWRASNIQESYYSEVRAEYAASSKQRVESRTTTVPTSPTSFTPPAEASWGDPDPNILQQPSQEILSRAAQRIAHLRFELREIESVASRSTVSPVEASIPRCLNVSESSQVPQSAGHREVHSPDVCTKLDTNDVVLPPSEPISAEKVTLNLEEQFASAGVGSIFSSEERYSSVHVETIDVKNSSVHVETIDVNTRLLHEQCSQQSHGSAQPLRKDAELSRSAETQTPRTDGDTNTNVELGTARIEIDSDGSQERPSIWRRVSGALSCNRRRCLRPNTPPEGSPGCTTANADAPSPC